VNTVAVVIEEPERLGLRSVELAAPTDHDVVVGVEWTGISTGTERLLYSGRMPPFPGMGYPLVPGYEAVGRIESAGALSGRTVGERVFVAGARCFGETRGLFGGAARRLVVPGSRALPLAPHISDDGVLLALTATAYHAAWGSGGATPDLIVGHGALGRLLARLAVQLGGKPVTVWETSPVRAAGAVGYTVIDPSEDRRRDYRAICDVSGAPQLLDELVSRLAPGGEVVLAGFYTEPLRFDYTAAFLRELRLRVAAEWKPNDLETVLAMVNDGTLDLGGIISHRSDAADAAGAYVTAFTDPGCVKMVLDWRACA